MRMRMKAPTCSMTMSSDSSLPKDSTDTIAYSTRSTPEISIAFAASAAATVKSR